MNIMELGAIGELVGGVAVIASLLYVGLQVRQSNLDGRAEAHRAFMTQWNRAAHDPLLRAPQGLLASRHSDDGPTPHPEPADHADPQEHGLPREAL